MAVQKLVSGWFSTRARADGRAKVLTPTMVSEVTRRLVLVALLAMNLSSCH